jgi:tetratricopeptide (TPR) repeat protein
VKKVIFVFVAALAAWQQPSAPAKPVDLERAYRANNLGVARLEQFDYDGAATSFRGALQIAPTLHIARLNLAIALLYAGRPADAAPEARAAAAELSGSATAHYVVGLIAKADNNLDEAAAAFERVLQIDARDAGARVQLGQVQLQRRRYDDALRLFQEALTAEPYNVTAAYNLAIAFARAGRTDESRPAMQRFEALRDSAYGVTYSQAYLGQGHYGEAIASTGAEPELVNKATPAVTFAESVQVFQPASLRDAAAAGTAGGITLFDLDGDGDLDLLDVAIDGTRLFRNDRGRFVDSTARALPGALASGNGSGAIAGDYDNDGRADLFVVRDAGPRLLHQAASGVFEDATAALPATTGAGCAAFVDLDHDGDLDIVAAGRAVQVLRNNGNGTFADISTQAGFGAAAGGVTTLAPADFDNRRDIDLLIAGGGAAPALFRNMRDGSFRDSAADAGLPRTRGVSSLAVGDINKDGYVDLFFGAGEAVGTFSMSDGRGSYRTLAGPDGTQAARASQFVDYDNDGLLDLLVMSEGAVRLFRNIGGEQWVDASTASRLPAIAPAAGARFQSLAVGDVDGDGDADFVVRDTSGTVRAWKNGGGSSHASVRVTLSARVSNRSGVGAKVELRAGSLRQMIETSSTTPAVAPAGVLFGLGSRRSPDVVRVLWPSGILQAEIPSSAGSPASSQAITVAELDRKPSSCPYLFTWNGTGFEFVTDFMGGGEMGDWVAPAQWNQPDPDEYVRIRDDQLKARNGRYALRITNELEEALFVDRVQLVAVDHRSDTEVYPNEGLRQPPRPPLKITATRNARPPERAVDEHGHDVRSRIAAMDRQYPNDFALLSIRGYAAPHALTLDLGAAGANPVLLLTGWTDYAFSNDNVAASQSRIETAAPSLQVKDVSGAWKTVIEDVGFPVGRPQTIAVDLAGKFLSPSREVRINTNMRIYWDQILVASIDARTAPRITRVNPLEAQLRWRGFSRDISPDGREPLAYDYARVSAHSPWKALTGRYTREGDVRTLLRRVDDMFVVSRPGDEIALSFDARAFPALPAGWRRTFLLYAHGYSKEMNPRSASPDTVAPLPFRAMTKYPYGPDEHYPDTPAHRDYLDRYNTRLVTRSVPSIDAAAR